MRNARTFSNIMEAGNARKTRKQNKKNKKIQLLLKQAF